MQTLPYFETCDGDGPPLLLVHGFLSSRAQWRPNLAALRQVARPVVLELFGHGRSPAPDQAGDYAVASYMAAFEAIRERLGVERWLVCGQSFGAGLTLRYALEHPGRVMGQVFTNSVSALSPPGRMSAAAGEAEARAAALETGGIAAVEALPFHPRHARRFDAAVKAEMLDDASRISPRGIANALRFTAPGLSVAPDFARTSAPTLLVNGVWEKSFQPLRVWAAGALPALVVRDVEGGHSVNLEAPAAFDAAVTDFIRSLPAES